MNVPQAVRTYLEITDPADLDGSAAPSDDTSVERVESPSPALWRFLYEEVGRQYHWVDRLGWSDAEVEQYLSDPGVELWVLRVGESIAGYFELRADGRGGIEIAYFGLLPGYVGRGFGGYLLTCAVRRAWERRAARVWLHTSSLDHAAALPNYLARGFRVWKQEVDDV